MSVLRWISTTKGKEGLFLISALKIFILVVYHWEDEQGEDTAFHSSLHPLLHYVNFFFTMAFDNFVFFSKLVLKSILRILTSEIFFPADMVPLYLGDLP